MPNYGNLALDLIVSRPSMEQPEVNECKRARLVCELVALFQWVPVTLRTLRDDASMRHP